MIYFIFNFMCIGIFLHIFLCEDVESSGAGLTGSCELPRDCCKLNPSPLKEQPVLLNTEATLRSHSFVLINNMFYVHTSS